MNKWFRMTFAAVAIGATCLAVTSASSAAPQPGGPVSAAPALAADPQLQPETHYVAITPCRIVDTRLGGGAIGLGAARSFFVGGTQGFIPQGGKAGGCGIPVSATAVAATVAAVNPGGGGYLKSWPAGSAEPTGGTVLNYVKLAGAVSTGSTLSIRPSAAQALTVRNQGPAVNAVIDISGYYVPQIQALIGGGGVISAGTARVLSVAHVGTGFYQITLDRPARQCSPSVSTFNLFRYGSVGLSNAATPNVISVSIWTLNATTHVETPSDYSFFLNVSC